VRRAGRQGALSRRALNLKKSVGHFSPTEAAG